METYSSDKPAIGLATGTVLATLLLALCGCRSPQDGGAGPVVLDTNDAVVAAAPAPRQDRVQLAIAALVNAARQHNAELLELREAMEVARAEAVTVTGLRNPELRVEYHEGDQVTERTWYGNEAKERMPPRWVPYTSASDRAVESDGTRYTVRLYPPNPWLMRIQGGGARARFAAASADVQAAEWRVECSIGSLLAEIIGLQRELEVARKQVVLRRDYLAAVQLLMHQQQATALDELDADQRQRRAEDDVALLEQTLQDRYMELSVLVGAPVQETGSADDTGVYGVPASVAPEKVRTLRDRLVETRAEVMAAYWRHQEALSSCRETRAGRIPWFTYVEGSVAKSESRDLLEAEGRRSLDADLVTPLRVISADENEDEVWSIEAGVEIPIFAFHPGATRIQRANVKRYAVALRESVRKAQAGFDMAYQGWLTAAARAESVRNGIAGRQAKAADLSRTLDESSGVGPEARLKLEETMLQLQRAGIQATLASTKAWWRFQESAGVRIPDRVTE